MVLEAVADALQDLVPHDALTLYQADLPLRLLRPVLCRDAYAEEILALGPLPFGQGVTGLAVESAEALLVNDAHLDPRSEQIPGTPAEPESMLAIPLMARDERKGVLCLYRMGEDRHFSDEEFQLATRFAALAALAIDNAQARARLEAEVITDHLTGLFNHRYFHERVGEEVRRSSRNQTEVGLLIYDIDDFKRVNDCYGHLVGDQVLQGVAALSRDLCREEDVLCRVGGEEFAVVLPGTDHDGLVRLAERLRRRVAATPFPVAGPISISVGVAEAPRHASSPRDLIARADLALLDAKTSGKNAVRVYGDATSNGQPKHRAQEVGVRGEVRSVAHLKMLQSLAAKLNRLNDIQEIAEVILTELRTLIDYHNCRIHLLSEDRRTLVPIAFRGHLLEYQGETFDALLTEVGEGITGHVASTGQSLLLSNARDFEGAVQIAGTPDVDESVLAVPFRHGDRVTGTVFLSKLGVDQFDQDDLRLLEVLASNAAVALENARLLQEEREAAEISGALLYLSDVLSRARDTGSVLKEALASIPLMLGCAEAQAWIRDASRDMFRVVQQQGFDPETAGKMAALKIPAEVAEPLILRVEEPFALDAEVVAGVLPEYQGLDPSHPRAVLVAPVRWEPGAVGAIFVYAADDTPFSPRQLRLARGIADITSLALAKASRFDELERAYVSTIEALANALEAQDEYTGDHARSLAEMALAVGKAFGLSGDRLKRLELAALFHDIGKIGVPSEIIRKPAPLSAEERRIMARHPEIGEEILEPVPFLQPIRPIIRACHERWDGGGYPDGKVGEEIPLEARIVFVCDAYHAMTTDRPYRSALPAKEPIRRLKLSAGTQFDPMVVKAFVKLHSEGKITFHSHRAAIRSA
jgi:diguanylate cyclase (GGDEF)-like protein